MTTKKPFRLAAAALLLSTPLAHGENLDVLMSQVFPEAQATYIGYESVERQDIPANTAIDRKYLIVDFRLASNQVASAQLQASVHKVCMTLLKDRDLVQQLSDSGYDMVSVPTSEPSALKMR